MKLAQTRTAGSGRQFDSIRITNIGALYLSNSVSKDISISILIRGKRRVSK